jgi:hypothetical protein
MFLRGAGGAALGLPLLPSLLTPRGALGQPAITRRPRFVAMATEHGGLRAENMYPDPATLTEKAMMFPGHQISYGPMRRRVEGTDALLSPVLKAPASLLTDRLVGKMNVLRGFDIPFYIAHHTGGHLGNYARNDGNGGDGKEVQSMPYPTIDQVMAWSPSFYRDLGGIKERSIITGTKGGLSFNWSNPTARNGAVQEVRPEVSSLALFNRVFTPAGMGPSASPQTPVVDRVLESYRTLRNSNRRMSALDRQRLDDHMERIAELQRRLNVMRAGSCDKVSRPTEDSERIGYSYPDPAKAQRKLRLFNDVIVAAFMCGSTRIAVVSVSDPCTPFSGDWHQDVAHKYSTTGQAQLVAGHRNSFEWAFLDLAAKLDVEELPGSTYLDNTLLQWTQESGLNTHDATSIPIVTAGSAAGYFKTGLYADFRNMAATSRVVEYSNFIDNAGLTWGRWLATAMQAMGLPRSEFERGGMPGYAHPYVSKIFSTVYVSGVRETASEVPAILKA